MQTTSEALRYGSDLHNHVKDAIGDRFDLSRIKLATRFTKWRQSEDLFMFYVKETDAEAKRRRERENLGKQTFSTIYVPYSYASLLSAFTYWSAVFLSRNPVFQFTGRNSGGQAKVQAVEALIDYQVQVGAMLVPLYLWLMDTGKYGVGILANDWVEEHDVITRPTKVPKLFNGVPIPGEYEDDVIYERNLRYKGNRVFNIRPYDFLPDPQVSFVNLQKGEFCGRVVPLSWNDVLRRSTLPPEDGGYFNIEALRKHASSVHHLRDRESGSAQMELPDDETFLWRRNQDWTRSTGDIPTPRRIEAVEMVIELVPNQWKLGKSTYPEKWAFTVGNREVIIGARPLGAKHGLFPYFIQSLEPDSYSFASRGMLELLKPLNDTLTWLFNSRMYNVRANNVGQYAIDPSRYVIKDIDGEPGKLIRLRPEYYGTDTKLGINPIPVVDVTLNHFKDASSVMELMQRVSGVNDNQQGVVFQGGRKTATEVRSSTQFGLNRLRTVSEFNSALGWGPLAQVLLQNTQQYQDEALEVKVAGSLLRKAQTIKVSPEDIAGFYDYVPVDGTLPIDRFAQANLWKELLIAIQSIPQVAMRYDIAGIFAWMAQIAGLKNIDQFEIQAVPDQMLMNEVAKGNMAPNGTRGTVPGQEGMGGTPEFPGLAALLGQAGGAGSVT
jgi:hypothetical protein